jgi:hypothetical protein
VGLGAFLNLCHDRLVSPQSHTVTETVT